MNGNLIVLVLALAGLDASCTSCIDCPDVRVYEACNAPTDCASYQDCIDLASSGSPDAGPLSIRVCSATCALRPDADAEQVSADAAQNRLVCLAVDASGHPVSGTAGASGMLLLGCRAGERRFDGTRWYDCALVPFGGLQVGAFVPSSL